MSKPPGSQRSGVPLVGPLSNNSNAGLRKLGCRPGDITQELFHSVSPGSGGGKIVRSELFGFWSQLSSPDSTDVKPFVDRLIDQLQNIDSSMNIATVNAIPPASIINTIAFMLFCTHPHPTLSPTMSVDKLQALQNTYSTGVQALSNPPPTNAATVSQAEQQAVRFAHCVDTNTSLKNLMRLISIRTLYTHPDNNLSLTSSTSSNPNQQQQPSSLDIDSILSPLVMYSSHLIQKDMRFVDWLRLPTIDSQEIQTNEHGFIYFFLSQLLAEQQRTNSANAEIILLSLLKAIYDKAHSLPQQIRMASQVAEQTFLSLFHMMRAFISSQAVLNVDFIERGIRLLTPFRWFPLPFGQIAEQMITLLKMEQLLPGYNRRRLVFQESRVINYQPTNPGSAQPSQYKSVKPIFYIYDALDSSSLPLLNVLDLPSLQAQNLKQSPLSPGDVPGSPYPPASILAQILVHILDGISDQTRLTQAEVNSLQYLTQESLIPFIQRLESFEDSYKSTAASGSFSVEQRELDFDVLKTDLLAAAKAHVNQTQQFSLPQHYNSLEALPGVYQEQYPPPPLPNIEHIRIPIELKAKTSEHEGNSQPGYPAAAMFDKLHQILQAYAPAEGAQPNLTKPREVRFVLIGNDRLVQHVATAYYLLRSHYPSVFAGLNVKFFLAPATRNHLANYLARLDLWYYRHIFTPFRSPFPFLIPSLREDETEIRPNHEGISIGFPTTFFRESVAQYVREAQHQFKPIIYKVEARVEPNSAEPSDLIPFLQRVEIGLTPAIEEFRIKGGTAFSNLRSEEIQKDKTFLYSPVDIVVKYSKVDLAGQPKPEMVDDSIPYQTILVSHVPRKGDPCTNPDPASVGIELYAQPAKVDKAKLKKNSLYFDQRQHIAEMSCTSPIPFKIVVDGVLHGPFRSVRIAIANWKGDGKIAQFPIQTFFPTGTVQSGL